MPSQRRSDPGQGSGPPRYPGTFLLALREAVAGLGWQVRRWLGDTVECLDAEGREHVVGLENVFRRARRLQRDEWPTLITEFLTSVQVAELADNQPTDLAAVAERLLVRLGRPFTALPDGTRVWSQVLEGTGFGINLVIDFPRSMSYVTEQLVHDSGRPGGDWLEQALANLRARTPADCFQEIHDESGMLLCNVADAYDSSRALLLDALLPAGSALGWFAALPGRDELLILPVTKRAFPHVHLLKVLALKNFKSAPYPISDEVFWIQQGVWRLFPIELGAQEISIRPPREFLPLLEQLAPPDGAAPETGPPSPEQ
jgi:hypothetical protein